MEEKNQESKSSGGGRAKGVIAGVGGGGFIQTQAQQQPMYYGGGNYTPPNPIMSTYPPPAPPLNPETRKFKRAVIASAFMNVISTWCVYSLGTNYFILMHFFHKGIESGHGHYDSAGTITTVGMIISFPIPFFCLFLSYYECSLCPRSSYTPGKVKAWIISNLIIIALHFLQIILLLISLPSLHPTLDEIIDQVKNKNERKSGRSGARRQNQIKSSTNSDVVLGESHKVASTFDLWYAIGMASLIGGIMVFILRSGLVGYIWWGRKKRIVNNNSGSVGEFNNNLNQNPVPSVDDHVYNPVYPPLPPSTHQV